MKYVRPLLVGIMIIGGIVGGNTLISSIKTHAAAKTATTAATSQNQEANAALDGIVSSFGTTYGNKVGIVVYDTTTDHTASTNPNEQFVSASLYKLYVAYGVLKEVDSGSLSLNTNISSLDESLNTCLNKMITISDNDCGKALGTLVGWENLDTTLQNEGYTGTMLNNYDSDGNLSGDKQTTAADISLLLKRLYAGTLLSSSSNALFLDLLGSQEINSYLPSGFPSTTKIAHKTGTLYGYVHDAGIVYDSNTNLIIVFMSGEWTDPDPDSIPVFKSFGQQIENYLETY